MRERHFGAMVLLGVLSVGAPAAAQAPNDLVDASLEELMNIKVISVSKKEQELFRTPSAIFVLTSEDISRSGASQCAIPSRPR
jgi:iron complex outermembrane receptor protein